MIASNFVVQILTEPCPEFVTVLPIGSWNKHVTPLHPFVNVYFILKFDTSVFEFTLGLVKDLSK